MSLVVSLTLLTTCNILSLIMVTLSSHVQSVSIIIISKRVNHPSVLFPSQQMSAIAARKAALRQPVVPEDAPLQPPSRTKTYAKKDKRRTSTRTPRRVDVDEPEDRVVVEIDVIDIRSDVSEEEHVEEDVELEEEVEEEEDVTETKPEVADPDDLAPELDIEESGLETNARPRKKRRVDTLGEAISNFTPVQGVNIFRLSVEDVERAFPSLPRRKTVVVILKPDEVSSLFSVVSNITDIPKEHRPQRGGIHYTDSKPCLAILIHPRANERNHLVPDLRATDASTSNDRTISTIIDDTPPDTHPAPSPDLRRATGSDRLPRPRTPLWTDGHARSRRRAAQSLSRREISVRNPGMPSSPSAGFVACVPVRDAAVVGGCFAPDWGTGWRGDGRRGRRG